MLIREKPPMKNVTVIGFCVTSNGALPNSASNSLRLIRVPVNQLLFEPGGVSYLTVRLMGAYLTVRLMGDPNLQSPPSAHEPRSTK